MLTYANQAIDTIQGAKTTFLNTFVTEAAFRKPLQAFVDSQTKFTKQVAETIHDMVSATAAYDYASAFKQGK